MQLKSRFSGQEAETYPAQIFLDSQGTDVPSAQLSAHVLEYGRLVPVFFKLYFQNQIISAQNLLLQCKLRLLHATFLFCKVQIFCARLAHGFPVAECWPKT
jgi:hypothetical protein